MDFEESHEMPACISLSKPISRAGLFTKGGTMAIVEEGEYKGNRMIILKNTEDDRWPFQFGLKKAKLILEHIDDIKKFVEKYDKGEEP